MVAKLKDQHGQRNRVTCGGLWWMIQQEDVLNNYSAEVVVYHRR